MRLHALGLLWSLSACSAAAAPPVVDPPVAVDPCAIAGHWEPVAANPLLGRVDHTAVWTGREMVLWGGTQGTNQPFADGARYDPATDAWSPTAAGAAPRERDDHAAVWTGREMLVWGGNSYSEDDFKLDDGGRYDPRNDTWRALPSARLTPRDDPRAVWTGTEMIVWGGRDAGGHTGDGARYDPARDRWRRVATAGAPAPREDHIALWTGREMLIWGGWNGGDAARNYALDGARYDPATDRWRPMASAGAPPPREDHTAIWTGREMIVWGGVVRDGRTRHQLASGGRYDPTTDTWTPLATTGAPSPREDGVVVWTGDAMLVWGGQRDERPLATGARYLPALDRWCPLPTDGAPVARRDHAGVWTGDALVLWGGLDPEGAYPADGARFVLNPRDGAGARGSLARSRPR
jgi:N-acetylneuraminic acid mutarotase